MSDCVNMTAYRPQVTNPLGWTNLNIAAANYSYSLAAAAAETADELIPAKPFVLRLFKNVIGYTILPGSVSFTWSGVRYIDRLGKLYRNVDPRTGFGVEAGTIDYSTGIVALNVYNGGSNTLTIHSMACRMGRQLINDATFRAPGAPLRPGSISISAVGLDGTTITGISEFNGSISGTWVGGTVDYDKAIVKLKFGSLVDDNISFMDEPWYDSDNVINGKIWKPIPVFGDTVKYTCVIYSYIPLNADLIGLDPVRLPSDGRVPICKPGDVVVIHNTQNDTLPDPLVGGQTVVLSRAGIVSVEIYDSSLLPVRVPSTSYSFDKDTHAIKMADTPNLAGFTFPLICMHRIEDMALVSSTQINGQLTVASGLDNAYPIEGTYVSTALLFGDLQSRAYNLFDQKTWTSVWADAPIGDTTAANFNEINYPIIVTNAGAVRERWALVFTAANSFNIVGEKYGIVGSGYITNDCQPINPSTGQPFFFIDYRGWGIGWATGNVVRFNTEGAMGDLWIARTTLQGPATEPSDMFTLQIRGDAE